MKARIVFSLSLFFLFALVFISNAFAQGPQEKVATHLASIQQILKRPDLAGTDRRAERRQLELILLNQVFDFREMSRQSLGPFARKYADRLGEFTPLFVDLLERNYLDEVETFGSDAKIAYVKERVEGEFATVETKVTLSGGNDYSVSYRLQESAGNWKIYDVVVENISLVNNYRSQFRRYLDRKTFDELLTNLREKKDRFK